jgi:shikimate dehydrogenase
MANSALLAALQRCISNPLAAPALGSDAVAGIIGDAPSHYSKSPALWNAAFRHLGMNAVYLPFDVDDGHVGELLALFKDSERFLGVNVTVPHKVRVIDFLDDLDAGAQRIGAVNTVVRAADGRLVGYNTDGEGFVESLLTPQPDRAGSFIPALADRSVLLLGAGGSARAVAFHVADMLRGGRLLISNRTFLQAQSLAGAVNKNGDHAAAIHEAEIPDYAPKAGLIVNSTTKGQGGMRRLTSGKVTSLEAYSALAPANPPAFEESESGKAGLLSPETTALRADIETNNDASMKLARSIPPEVAFYDLIYHPAETVFLRHGRLTGHPTMNGKAMIINQAVIAFCKRICLATLKSRNLDSPDIHRQILDVMYRAW